MLNGPQQVGYINYLREQIDDWLGNDYLQSAELAIRVEYTCVMGRWIWQPVDSIVQPDLSYEVKPRFDPDYVIPLWQDGRVGYSFSVVDCLLRKAQVAGKVTKDNRLLVESHLEHQLLGKPLPPEKV